MFGRVVFSLLSLALAVAAERPWQKIVIPPIAEAAASFRTPPSQYGVILWWGWDGPMSQAVIQRDLDNIKALGFSSVMIEPGYGMTAPYLSAGWFELIRTAVAEAGRRGMHVWLVDEGKYPSGFAGGKFSTERPDLRMQALVVAEKIDAVAGQTLSRKLTPETVGVVAVNLADGSGQTIACSGGELNWTAPEGKWQVLIVEHQFRTSQTRSVNNPTRGKDTTASLFDYLNPDATRQFLDFTEVQYKKYVGDEFGRTVLGFRGDEPDFAYTPWTPKLPAEFERQKGYNVRPYLASFFIPHPSDDVKRVKADYWDVWSNMFRDNFFKVQADWCAANNLDYRVHLNHEDMLMQLVKSEGDFFKDMRYVQVPGIDAIWHQIWMDEVADFPKLASSAAHLFGRPRSFTESFAAYRPPPDVVQAKWIMDEQMVRGINDIEIMFYPSSAKGEHKPPGFLGSDQFPALARYANRATYLLSLGRPTAQIGVYLPTGAMWLGDEEAYKTTLRVAKTLLEHQRDFDFIDEQALSSVMTLSKGAFRNLSGAEYRAIILPAADRISKSALDRLRRFSQSGGSLIFIQPDKDLDQQVLGALPPPDLALDKAIPSVKYLHRRLQDGDLYFFFNESDQSQSSRVWLSGTGRVHVWDATAGEITEVNDAIGRNHGISLPLNLQPYESRFIVVHSRK